MKPLSIRQWYHILRGHHQWTMFQAIRYALWLTRKKRVQTSLFRSSGDQSTPAAACRPQFTSLSPSPIIVPVRQARAR